MTISLPEDFRQHMRTIHGAAQADAWLQHLPAIVARCARRWQLTILPPIEKLSYHYVTPARCADGTPVVVKVCSPTGEFAREAHAMQLFADRGGARVLAVDETDEVLLLERLLPGSTLAHLVPAEDERATAILCAVMRQLWRPAPARHTFPTVAQLFTGLQRLRAHFGGGSGPIPPYLLEAAEAQVAGLLARPEPPLLLHGDLHHENILLADGQWRVIDAKGVVGDPGYETALLFYNPLPYLFSLPNLRTLLARRLDQISAELAMDRARIRGWGLAGCVLSTCWSLEDGEQVPGGVLQCAEILAHMR
ncbi:MAG TPA: aminoglycoside phosphotransferase family protein [Ktedonobacteraceae bacterium]|jgi:streptomycin 6-kinase